MLKGLTFMHWSGREESVVKRLKAGAVLVGLAWALSATLAACAMMCAWVVLSSGPVYNFSAFIAAGSIIGAILGGAASGKAAGTLGLLHGFVTGSFYGLLLVALFIAGSPEGFSAVELGTKTALLGIAGSIGGVFGVNLYKGKAVSGRRLSNQR